MNNFAIISYLDDDLTKKIRDLQVNLMNVTGSARSVEKNDPHITVGSEISVDDKELPVLYRKMEDIAYEFMPQTINIDGFGFMEDWVGGKLPGHTPYVVYLKVIEYKGLEDLVYEMKRKITDHFPNRYIQPFPYKPHITLAYNDLTKEGFEKAKKYLADRDFRSSAEIDHFSIVRKDTTGKWIEKKRFVLGKFKATEI